MGFRKRRTKLNGFFKSVDTFIKIQQLYTRVVNFSGLVAVVCLGSSLTE
jgi:hypothetical protein